MKLDVTITAVRRPDLFAATLSSFSDRLLRHFEVNEVFLNIDPAWGTESEAERVRRLAEERFPRLIVRTPSTPSFGAAVKWLWSQPKTEWFLHMEDDWVLAKTIMPSHLGKALRASDVAQMRLHNWTRLQRRRRKPTISTGPSFVRAEFARQASLLLNPEMDPEKQFRSDRNAALRQMAAGWRTVYAGGPLTRRIAVDIGRDWRQERRIGKEIVDGAAVWNEH